MSAMWRLWGIRHARYFWARFWTEYYRRQAKREGQLISDTDPYTKWTRDFCRRIWEGKR